ncbi:MAG: GIY-YIG nuclease family protein [Candidatus Omnitrophica bacterium]|nr:GIY-YIG nuclease family protein [Candidatus Omnitrophota bacterium]
MYYIYILANKKDGTLYIGVTNNLIRRTGKHKQNLAGRFTKKRHVHKLVYFESTSDIREAIYREKCMKRWRRQWKVELIEKDNPCWEDLYYDII